MSITANLNSASPATQNGNRAGHPNPNEANDDAPTIVDNHTNHGDDDSAANLAGNDTDASANNPHNNAATTNDRVDHRVNDNIDVAGTADLDNGRGDLVSEVDVVHR